MNNKDNKLIWESYVTKTEGIEDDFMDFADENPSKKPQPTKTSSLKLKRPPEEERDEYGRKYLYKGPKDGAYAREEQMRQALENLPMGMSDMFQPGKEGSYYVIEPNDDFKSYSTDGDGMGGTIEHNLGYAIVGLADGNFLDYIKHGPPDEEDDEDDVHHQTVKDYMRGEGL